MHYNSDILEKETVYMGLQYKIDVLSALKASGYNTTRLRREQLLSESTIQKLRTGAGVSWSNLETLCRLLGRQPGELIEYAGD